ncbi:exodeoxyribonuclease I [Alteromonas macleodii]|uniref:exodeoxyribonuclease I n=1 Tax=Alteromonas macleodii TaxID=28108 RepID=UPI00313FF1FB
MSREFIRFKAKVKGKSLSLPELERGYEEMSAEYRDFVRKSDFINFFTEKNGKSFLWHDYETWGANPRRDQTSQYAAIRTDRDLNFIDVPTNIYCKPSPNRLPNPIAVSVTHLSPLYCHEHGIPEYEFFSLVREEMLVPGTCQVAYNGINFDREVTRFGFYRNLFAAYEHEFANDNSVWDIVMLGAMIRAVRPEGINWPTNDEGRPSIRLEHLAPANNIIQENCHNAIDDVKATVDWARLLKKSQPRTWDFLFKYKHKKQLKKYIQMGKPYLLTNMAFGLEYQYTAPVLPLFYLRNEPDSLICINLREDFDWIKNEDASELRKLLYSTKAELEESGKKRPPLVKIKLAKCPAIAPLGVLNSESVSDRVSINAAEVSKKAGRTYKDKALISKAMEIYDIDSSFEPITQVEEQLYGFNFFDKADNMRLQEIHSNGIRFGLNKIVEWKDERINKLLFRIIAKSHPQQLSKEQLDLWKKQCLLEISETEDGNPNFENFKKMASEHIPDLKLRNEYISYVENIQQWLTQ